VPAQRRFIADVTSWCLALCGRQCGKGWSVARMLVLTAMSRPDSVCIYARRTLGLAKTTMWLQEPTDGIPAVLRQLGLVDRDDPNRPNGSEWHYELNLSETAVRFRNGSVIRLIGVERQVGWADVRGHKFMLFVLDEMQEQEETGLVQALTSDLPYCMMRWGGRFVGIGTPGHVAVGRFHDICAHVRDPKSGVDLGDGWEVHRWTAEVLRDRTPVWDGLLSWKQRFMIPDTHPKWRRDGLGEWAADESDLMLHLGENALWDGALPDSIPDTSGRMVRRSQAPIVQAGLDFGFSAPSGIVVTSVSREEGVLREVWSGKRSGLVTKDLAAWMREVMSEHPTLQRFYGDHEDPGKIEELRREYGLPVEPCDKRDYEFMVGEMRSCALEGRLKSSGSLSCTAS
jgi:hypothetical protein